MRKFVLFFMAVFGCCVCALAQNGKVSGTVTSADGKPIAGATVVIKGSHVGTSTNADGKYTLNVRPGDVLQVSFIGMQTQRIPVNGKTTVDVTMQDDAIGLDNVVITALGITRQERTLGYASTTIKADEIAKGHAADAMNRSDRQGRRHADLLVGRHGHLAEGHRPRLFVAGRQNSKIKPNKSCKKFHARKLSFFVVAFSKMILAMGCKAAKRLYSLASHSQNR